MRRYSVDRWQNALYFRAKRIEFSRNAFSGREGKDARGDSRGGLMLEPVSAVTPDMSALMTEKDSPMDEMLSEMTPDISALITEDDTPVDNLPSEKQQRLLTEPLYSSWTGPGDNRPFLAAAQ